MPPAGGVGEALFSRFQSLGQAWGMSTRGLLGVGFRMGAGAADGVITDAIYQGSRLLSGAQTEWNWGQSLMASGMGAVGGLFMKTFFAGE